MRILVAPSSFMQRRALLKGIEHVLETTRISHDEKAAVMRSRFCRQREARERLLASSHPRRLRRRLRPELPEHVIWPLLHGKPLGVCEAESRYRVPATMCRCTRDPTQSTARRLDYFGH